MTDHKPCDQDALIDVIAGAVDPANFGMRPEYYGNVAGAVEMAAAALWPVSVPWALLRKARQNKEWPYDN